MSAISEKRVALVGLGAASRSYLSALEEFPELVLDSLVEPDPGRALPDCAVGLRAFRHVTDLLRFRAVPDIAILCTPPATRAEIATPLLLAGVDLLCETPLATTPDDADLIATLSERLGRTVVTAARFRKSAALLEALGHVRGGRIGRVREIECSLSAKRDAACGWRADPALSGGGAWADLGPDALSLVEALAGPVEKIRMVSLSAEQKASVEDEVRVETDHADGVRGKIELSWNRQSAAPLLRAVGECGELRVGRARSSVRTESGEEISFAGCEESDAASSLIAELLRSRLEKEPEIDPGARHVACLHAAYRSVRDARWQHA